MARPRERFDGDDRLQKAARALQLTTAIAALLPLVGFSFGLTLAVIPFAALAFVGALGARSDAAAWFTIVYWPVYHSLAFYSLLISPLLGSIPMLVGTFLWLLYIQMFLFVKGYGELLEAEKGIEIESGVDDKALLSLWIRRAAQYAVPALACYVLAMIPVVGTWLLAALFLTVVGYGGYVYLKVAQ